MKKKSMNCDKELLVLSPKATDISENWLYCHSECAIFRIHFLEFDTDYYMNEWMNDDIFDLPGNYSALVSLIMMILFYS